MDDDIKQRGGGDREVECVGEGLEAGFVLLNCPFLSIIARRYKKDI